MRRAGARQTTMLAVMRAFAAASDCIEDIRVQLRTLPPSAWALVCVQYWGDDDQKILKILYENRAFGGTFRPMIGPQNGSI